jgi:ATP-binding cassette subfamily B protein
MRHIPPPPKRLARVGSLRLLLPYLRPYRLRTLAATAALLTAAGLILTLGQGLRRLIDFGFATSSQAHLDHAALAMAGVVACLGVATAARFYLVSWLGERVAADLRRDTFDRVISLSATFFETARLGDILTRLTADISVLQALIGSAISQWMRNAILLAGAFTMLLVTSAKLAGIVVLVVPAIVVPTGWPIWVRTRRRRSARCAPCRPSPMNRWTERCLPKRWNGPSRRRCGGCGQGPRKS